jgi:hypothetical protein
VDPSDPSEEAVHFRTQASMGGQLSGGAGAWCTGILIAIKSLPLRVKGSEIATTGPGGRVLIESGADVIFVSMFPGVRRCK